MSSKLKIAYFGTPYFSADFLEKLITDSELKRLIEIKFVVTQSDKPVGRKQILTPTPVKQVAIKYHIPITTHLKTQKSKCKITSQNLKINKKILDLSCGFEICDLSFDIGLVYAFAVIIPKELLSLPKYGFWCIHPSLLPKYRGPSPIAYPLILGDKKTGVTLFQMDEKIDHGPIIAQEETEILPDDRRSDLEIKLTDLAFEMFKKITFQLTSSRVNELKSKKTRQPVNTLTLKPQNHKYATYTRLLKKEDGFIPLEILKKTLENKPLIFEELPQIIKEYLTKYPDEKQFFFQKTFNFSFLTFNLFRGLYPWPGTWTILPNSKRLKIIEMKITTNHQLLITKVQLEGKREVDFTTFNKAYRIF